MDIWITLNPYSYSQTYLKITDPVEYQMSSLKNNELETFRKLLSDQGVGGYNST